VLHRLSRISGFHVRATDGAVGHIDDFLVDEQLGRICYLVVDTSNWLGGKWVAVSPDSIDRVVWTEREVYVRLTRDEIKSAPSMEETSVPSHELAPRFVII
jgi:PRC-barrel domain